MKKYLKYIIITILTTLIILSIILLIIYNNNKKVKEEYFTIKESYGYIYKEESDDIRQMSLKYYSNVDNGLLSYPSLNVYTLNIDDDIYQLDNVSITTKSFGKYYQYTLHTNVLSTTSTISGNLILKIKNDKYTASLDLGTISIIPKSNYKLLSIDRLSACYSYINNNKYLVGINLSLTNTYTILSNFTINDYTYAQYENIKEDVRYDSLINIKDVMPRYRALLKPSVESYEIKSNTIFIPISYPNLTIIESGYIKLKLDGIDYYIDYMPFVIENDFIYDSSLISEVVYD